MTLPRNWLGKPLAPKLAAVLVPGSLDNQLGILLGTLLGRDRTGHLVRGESEFRCSLSCHISHDEAFTKRGISSCWIGQERGGLTGMIGDYNGTGFFGLMVDRTGDMVGRGLGGAIRAIDELRWNTTGTSNHGRRDEEFRNWQRAVGFGRFLEASGDEKWVRGLVEVERAEGVHVEVCLVVFGGFLVDGYKGGINSYKRCDQRLTSKRGRTRRTSISNDNVQSIRDFLDLFHCLLVTLFVVRDQLDDVDSGVLVCELIKCICRGRLTSTRPEYGFGVSFEEGEDEIVADSSVGTRNCGAEVSIVGQREGRTHRECRSCQWLKSCRGLGES